MRFEDHPYLTRDEERTAPPVLLVLSHGRLVAKMAKRFARYGLDVEDLVQEGHIGLLHAARKFDPEKGFRFATYASWWVRERMAEAVFRGCNVVRPNTGVAARAGFFRARPPHDVSMDAPVSGGDATLADILACPAPLPDALAESSIDDAARLVALRAAIASLEPRDREIVTGRFLAEPKQSLEELGGRLGLSKERVRQLEVRALERLRAVLLPEGNDQGEHSLWN